ncbi:hypothetical protein SAMN05216184_11252 [Georgenia satyanarayanai]|uniref:Uncharacterized protein n=1 Tax=Georgenia satyanarayanai TaxID=860221 RepID=A0A2Y9C7D3_9MICO|nr:hypothetical protein A8987_11252 [Georgenia satyanarayanai]SSA45193.1 hypothetical protein SAMN05216184_11252 [Georgenia satyanarayanai]
MGTQRDHLVETATSRTESASRTESWRDTLAAKYEMQQAVLRFTISEFGDSEEFL